MLPSVDKLSQDFLGPKVPREMLLLWAVAYRVKTRKSVLAIATPRKFNSIDKAIALGICKVEDGISSASISTEEFL